jgi:hypothetical protein
MKNFGYIKGSVILRPSLLILSHDINSHTHILSKYVSANSEHLSVLVNQQSDHYQDV